MNKNTSVITFFDFDSCGYDYRVDLQDGTTVGYLSRDSRGDWMFSNGSTPSEAATSDPVSYECYTLSELKDELELEYAEFKDEYEDEKLKWELDNQLA